MQTYDPTEEQRITTKLRGREVQHIIPPITEDTFLEFLDRNADLDQEQTLILFYDLFVDRLEGLSGALPANWKELLPASEKRDVAGKTLVTVWFTAPEEPEAADAAEVKDEDGFSFSDYVSIDRNERSYLVHTYFNGSHIQIPVRLRLYTAKERKDLRRVLTSETSTNRFQTEYAARIVKQAMLAPRYYLPINLLGALAVEHLTADTLVIEKN